MKKQQTAQQAAVERLLAIDFGMKDGKRTLDRSPDWFLEHSHYSYEWYRTGQGSPFRNRRGRCLSLSVPERLDLALELLDMPEVRLWAELGWGAEAINMAALKSGSIQLSDEQLSAIAATLGLSPAWLLHAHGPLLSL